MAKTINVEKQPGTSVVNWTERLAKVAVKQAAAEVVPGKFLSFKSGCLTYNGQMQPKNEMLVVVVASLFENHWYSTGFDADQATSPDCFAFGAPDDDGTPPVMRPHANVKVPVHETCKGCPKNEWGSQGEGKRGKACKEIRRLALIPADAVKQLDKMDAAPFAFARISVTNVKNWSAYVNLLATHGVPPWAVVTRLSLTPHPKSQFQVNFEMMAKFNDDEVLTALERKSQQAEKQIDFPYEAPQEQPPPQTTAQKTKKSKIG